MAEALYRKYRPQIFEDVVGQDHIERTIKNAIDQDKLSHAYLFTGPRGTGKTTTARLLAKALLCGSGPTSEPDGTCDDCLMIARSEHPDVYELDAASRTGVENVREEIIGRVQFAPTRGRYKVYIIDEVHMLSSAAFNALLKTLEEPPSHVVFILATTDPQKVPETIHSRCQCFEFRRISMELLVSRLGAICVSEGVEFEGEALDLIAHRAEGGMRNALTSLEQLIAFGEGKVTLEVAERMLGGVDTNDLAEIAHAVGTRDIAACFRWTAEFVETGADLAQFTRDFAEHIRNLYVMALTEGDVVLEVGETERRQLAQELPLFGVDRLARLLGVLGDLSAELRVSSNARLSFEIALTRMVRPDSDLTLESLAERVEALESGYSAVSHVMSTGTAPAAPASEAVPVAASLAAQQPIVAPPSSVGSGCRAAATSQVAAQSVVAPVVVAPATTPAMASPAAATPAAASQLGGSLKNPAALQRVWQAVLSTLKKNKAAYGVLFLNTKATYDEAKHSLAIEFPAENAFAFKAVQKPDVQTAVSTAITQACGEAISFSYVQVGNAAPVFVANAAQSAVAQGREAFCAAPAAAPAVAPAAAPAAAQVASSAAASVVPEAPTPGVSTEGHSSYDEDQVPYDDFDIPAVKPVIPEEAMRVSPPSPSVSASSEQSFDSGQPESTPADLQAILMAGFGDGVVLKEL